MKAIEITRHGGPEVLQVVERPQPTAGPGQILIQTQAVGINFADLMSRAGTYPLAPKPPFVPGFEAAGVVAAIGEGVTNFKAGDRVAAMTSEGYAEYAVAEAATAAPLPDALGFAEATALLVQGLTAYGLLTNAVPDIKGKSVLVSAAAGGVGSLAVQIAKLLGAGTVVGLASSEAKRAQVLELGADAAIDYTQPGWAEQVKAATGGQGVDIFLDASGDNTEGGLKPLGKGGHWVLYGAQSNPSAGLSGMDLIGMAFAGQTVSGWSMYNFGPDLIAPALAQLIGWAVGGRLTVIAKDRFPLAEAAAAHRAIESRQTTGKVVLEP